MARYWFSWKGPEDDYRPVIWPLPPAWLGYWCSGYGDNYTILIGWAENPEENPEEIAKLVKEGWPEWDGVWRIDPTEKPEPPGDRFPRPRWADAARWNG